MLRLAPLDLDNFEDYVRLTACGDDGKPCYCSFWHLKVGSIADYDALKAKDPLALREVVRGRVQAGFHVGALAYEGDDLVAWISVALLPEVYWCWRRVAALGVERAGVTAGITCVTLDASARGRGLQEELARALADYGGLRGWKAVEAYPFDDQAIATNPKLAWPGYEAPYRAAGFARVEAHWLSQPGFERWICRRELG
ncbi:MAG: hypothetical protein U0263_28785 [Polyangiaceae bacterium]